jgi:hypothetical protein
MWSYTSDENSWLSRTGQSILDYCEKTGTARAHRASQRYVRYVNQYNIKSKTIK